MAKRLNYKNKYAHGTRRDKSNRRKHWKKG